MSEIIVMVPERVDEYANEIERLGRDMKAKMEEVHLKVKGLEKDWKDNVQIDYEAEFSKVAESFSSLSSEIPKYAAKAHEHADNLRRIGT